MNHHTNTMGGSRLWLAALLLMLPVLQARAATFLLDYSGAVFGNNAEAHGTITFDESLLPNPADGLSFLSRGVEVTGLSLTVSNAASGNGSFGLADYDFFTWDTAGAALDLSRELVGQATPNGGWGTFHSDGAMGEFGMLANGADPAAPSSAGWFSLLTDNGGGDKLYLTSLRPVPEPPTLWLSGAGVFALAARAASRGLRGRSFSVWRNAPRRLGWIA